MAGVDRGGGLRLSAIAIAIAIAPALQLMDIVFQVGDALLHLGD